MARSFPLVFLSVALIAVSLHASGSVASTLPADAAKARGGINGPPPNIIIPDYSADQRPFIIQLNKTEDDASYLVELIPCRVEAVDGVNNYSIDGVTEEKTQEGLGYVFYESTLGNLSSTLIAASGEDAKLRWGFVVATGGVRTVPYSSTQPIVVLAPTNALVYYRVVPKDAVMDGQQTWQP